MKALRLGLLISFTLPACLPAQAQTGPGSALNFTAASSQYAQVPASSSLTPSNYTFEAWVAPRTASYSCCTILSRGDGGFSSDYIFEIGYNGSVCNSGKLGLFTGGAWNYSTNTVPTPGWAHVAVTFDGTTVRFFINGVPSGSSIPGGPLTNNGTVLFLGRQGTTCNCNFFDGSMDEVRIWNVVRTQAQLQQNTNHALTGAETGLVAYYKMDEGGGATLTNSASTGAIFNGACSNSVSWTLSGARFVPALTTGSATGISGSSATLNGTVNPGNLASVAWFQWGATTSYGNNSATNSLPATNATLSISNALTGLAPATFYHFRIVASNSAGTNFGGDQVFFAIGLALGTTNRLEGPAAGLDSVVLAAATAWTATSNVPWLHLDANNQSGVGSTNVIFSFDANPGVTRTGTLTIAGLTLTVTQAGSTYVAAGALTTLVGSGLHFPYHVDVYIADLGNHAIKKWLKSSNVVTTVVSSGLTNPVSVAVDGAGNLYIPDGSANTLFKWTAASNSLTSLVSTGLNFPTDVALDGAGNVYIADGNSSTIKEWVAASNLLTTVVSNGLMQPYGVAVDTANNVYIVDSGHNALKELVAANNTVIPLATSGLSFPEGAAVDGAGNVYFADRNNNAVKEWVATSNNAIKEWSAGSQTVTTLVGSGLNNPDGVAVDRAGNVYIADQWNAAVEEWSPINGTVTTIWSAQYTWPLGVAVDFAGNAYASYGHFIQEWGNTLVNSFDPYSNPRPFGVDGGGNVYFIDNSGIFPPYVTTNAVRRWSVATQSPTPVVCPGLVTATAVAADGMGSVYIFDGGNLRVVPRAFVDPTSRLESSAAGSDVLSPVVPATQNLLPPFAPTSDQPWLSITGITNGVVSFGFLANTGAVRYANITLLGQRIPVTQAGAPNHGVLAVTNLAEGPGVGTDSVILANPSADWTATSNVPWLHLSAANQSGIGSTNVIFSFDSNPGGPRTGTLSIGGQTLTISQAGSAYVAAGSVTLVSSGLQSAFGLAVDGAGNVYIADSGNNAVREWVAANNTLNTLVSGLNVPMAVAADAAGNVFIADMNNNAIKEWSAASQTVSTLVGSGLYDPDGVAVDRAGNVYIADQWNAAVKEWSPINGNVTTILSGTYTWPLGVAVDFNGNVYASYHFTFTEWNTTLVSLYNPSANPQPLAVDGGGNVYLIDNSQSAPPYITTNAVRRWSVATQSLTPVVCPGLNTAYGVTADGAGSVYIFDGWNNSLRAVPRAFVDPTPHLESSAAGTDVLSPVVPATQNLLPPFGPTSDQAWLTITGVTNGAVSFGFLANTGAVRTANITVLGQTIPVTQSAVSLATATLLTGVKLLANGSFQFSFTNTPGASFTVLSTTNVGLPLLQWTPVGAPVENPLGQYQFTDTPTASARRFYIIRSP